MFLSIHKNPIRVLGYFKIRFRFKNSVSTAYPFLSKLTERPNFRNVGAEIPVNSWAMNAHQASEVKWGPGWVWCPTVNADVIPGNATKSWYVALWHHRCVSLDEINMVIFLSSAKINLVEFGCSIQLFNDWLEFYCMALLDEIEDIELSSECGHLNLPCSCWKFRSEARS